MLKKKSVKKPAEKDFSALDDAVSELSKQTAALWSKPDKAARPVLPKRNGRPQARGKSFDIIHPSTKAPTKAHLKTVKSGKTDALPSVESPALLPDHAGTSYNELPQGEEGIVPSPEPVAPPAIINHREGKLHITDSEAADENAVPESAPTDDAQLPANEPAAPEPTSSKPTAQTSISFEEKVPSSTDEPAEPAETSTEEKAQINQSDTYASGELFANNLVKDTEPKRHEPNEAQQKPTVFDTNEYHPALHDWSKLEHRSGSKVFILVLLLAVLGGLGYVMLSGISLPFVD